MSMQSGKTLVKQAFNGKRAVKEALERTQLLQNKANLILGYMSKNETSEAMIPC